MKVGPGRALIGSALLAALAVIPYCARNRADRAALDTADVAAAQARAAANRAAGSAAEAAAAAKAAEHAADDVRTPNGPGS